MELIVQIDKDNIVFRNGNRNKVLTSIGNHFSYNGTDTGWACLLAGAIDTGVVSCQRFEQFRLIFNLMEFVKPEFLKN